MNKETILLPTINDRLDVGVDHLIKTVSCRPVVVYEIVFFEFREFVATSSLPEWIDWCPCVGLIGHFFVPLVEFRAGDLSGLMDDRV
ncbi:hypothetical protein [Halosolutus gelatinilyticus]|uniref:hypothetical protein n=1 Tax=Halosolutus gelatinilyticus TaxID=2931975 RepID=UPI003CE5AD16